MDSCKLCRGKFEKFPKSHIIPDFMYKTLKSNNSTIFRMRMPVGKKLRPVFSGYYQKPLLCFSCEKKFNAWESYAEKVLYGSTHIKMPVVKKTNEDMVQHASDIDYLNFKLFLLSVLWRASVTSHSFFKEVSLGLEHEEKLRKMLEDDNPGDEDEYPILLISPKGDTGSNVAIGAPYKNKTKMNAIRYVFPIAEMIYVFHISKHGLEEVQKKATIKKDNTMLIIYWPTSRLNAFLDLYQVKAGIRRNQLKKFKGGLY